jgi:hypothetical protein
MFVGRSPGSERAHKDQIRGFVDEVTTGTWREVTEST